MKDKVKINGIEHLIEGEWVVIDTSLIFKGKVINLEQESIISLIEFNAPLNFAIKNGIGAINNEIAVEVKNSLEK